MWWSGRLHDRVQVLPGVDPMSAAVSRETPPVPPPGAAEVFDDRLDLAVRFAGLLADAGVTRGLIGPREVPRLWDRHLINCALLADGCAEGDAVCDVGSGAGLPGLVLGLLRPDLQITLLEPLLRRVTFLQEAVDALELQRVRVLRGRAEDQRGQRYDVVTARAVAPLDRLARWCLPLCRPGGRLLAVKGASAAEELDRHAGELRRLGARAWRLREYAAADAATLVVEVVAGGSERRRPRPQGTDIPTPSTCRDR